MFWTSLPGNTIRCMLCPHHCVLLPNHTGICRQYQHQDSRLISLSYGSAASIAIDPIEKNPYITSFLARKYSPSGDMGAIYPADFAKTTRLRLDQVLLNLLRQKP